MKLLLSLAMMFGLLSLSGTLEAKSSAQYEIVAASTKSRTHIDLFANAGDTESIGRVAVGDIEFPITALQTKSGFIQVRLQEKLVWVRSTQVRRDRKSASACTPAVRHHQTGLATPGVSRKNC